MVAGGQRVAVVAMAFCGAACTPDRANNCRVAAQRWNAPPELASTCKILSSERDASDPAFPDWATTYSYAADGNLSMEEWDRGIDGTVDGRVVYGYDPDGTLRFTDNDYEGGAWRESYEYNDAGDRVSIEFLWSEGAHNNAIYTFEHDTVGNVVTELQDFDSDGVADNRIAWEYDGCNPLTETHISSSSAFTSVSNYTYDQDGNLLAIELDSGDNGSVDARVTYSHDADGNIISEESDLGADGTIEQQTSYTYDAQGNRLTEQRDDDLDGVPEFSATHMYQCP